MPPRFSGFMRCCWASSRSCNSFLRVRSNPAPLGSRRSRIIIFRCCLTARLFTCIYTGMMNKDDITNEWNSTLVSGLNCSPSPSWSAPGSGRRPAQGQAPATTVRFNLIPTTRHGRRRPTIHVFLLFSAILTAARKTKTHGWSAFADHDGEREVRVPIILNRLDTNRINTIQLVQPIKPDSSGTP